MDVFELNILTVTFGAEVVAGHGKCDIDTCDEDVN
jgi:hypothetical protein